MTYNVIEKIDKFGKEKLLNIINNEGLNLVELHKLLSISKSDKRISSDVYKRIFNYLGIEGLPYSNIPKASRKFYLELDKFMPNYWESIYIVEVLLNRMASPTLNYAEDRVRGVISFPRHPHSNTSSWQIKAHIVAWEIYNKQYVPEGYWVIPKDNDYLNLTEENLIIVNTTKFKSDRFKDKRNPAYLHGHYNRPRLGGWSLISELYRKNNSYCKICNSTIDLIVHHIISYHLFINPVEANNTINLITLCRHCHGKVHQANFSLKETLISEMRYEKLIELLETLKSQVPESLMETYKDVEKQLGLTDNQQPSH